MDSKKQCTCLAQNAMVLCGIAQLWNPFITETSSSVVSN